MLKRRQFLTGATAVVGSYILTACGGGTDSGAASPEARANAAQRPSPDGTTIPPASSIIDASGNTWTVKNGVIYQGSAKAGFSQNVTLLLLYGGKIYQSAYGSWWVWSGSTWNTSSDPRVASSTGPAIGVHCEGDNDVSLYAAFSAWLGKPDLYRLTFTARDSWSDVAAPYFLSATQTWIAQPGRYEVMSVPLLLGSDTFASIAGGAQDATWQALANNIKSIGNPAQVIIRLGWEHNGNWYAWNSRSDPNGYAAAFAHVAQVMKAIAPGLRFDWCTDFQAYDTFNWQTAYPGDASVDIVSMDVYDEWNPNGWSDITSGAANITQLRAFAAAHGKKEAYPEWSCSIDAGGHGDNPTFITNMYNWLMAGGSNVLYHSYWNTNLGGPNAAIQGPLSGNVPLAAAQYKALFSR
ncbi:glycoside hydrolase family 26 protein [Paraburkholderia youngii]|uniref:glycoside hydrolase family 26 protein n=1 Tax=Paraburkholderia youngii TaxID=2782701 RepID=UPI003D2622C9